MQYMAVRVICSPNEKCLDFTLCRFYVRFAEFHASCLFVGSYTAILSVAVEGCVGLTEVLAAGVAARTWVGLDISG